MHLHKDTSQLRLRNPPRDCRRLFLIEAKWKIKFTRFPIRRRSVCHQSAKHKHARCLGTEVTGGSAFRSGYCYAHCNVPNPIDAPLFPLTSRPGLIDLKAIEKSALNEFDAFDASINAG